MGWAAFDGFAVGALRRRGVRTGVVALALLSGLALPQGSAGAVTPGANGKIVCEGGRGDPRNPEVFSINPDGTGETVLTDHPARDGDPSFSPDGTKIAFESFRDGSSEVYVMNADGTGVTRLTFAPGEDRGTSWSPDGSRIAFHSARFPAAVPGPGHSSLEILTMNADGSDQVRLTENNFQDALASWSPDGTKIAFNSNRDLDHEIYVMDADGSNQTRLTFSPREDAHPMWSPDGSQIAFHSRRRGTLDIFVMDADGSDVRRITTTDDAHEFFPVWSPDGTQISFTGNTLDPSGFDVYVIDADGGNITQLTFNGPGVFDGRCDWGVLTPAAKDECKQGTWQQYNVPARERFKNQGQCVKFVNEADRNRL
jgi:Tol biopolymer transport system component